MRKKFKETMYSYSFNNRNRRYDQIDKKIPTTIKKKRKKKKIYFFKPNFPILVSNKCNLNKNILTIESQKLHIIYCIRSSHSTGKIIKI